MRSYIFLASYVLFVNALAFFLMWSDKRRAVRIAYRIPEATLFGVALIGGSAGAIAGMYLFRHKTRHRRFTIGMPVILLLQILLIVWVRSRVQLLFL